MHGCPLKITMYIFKKQAKNAELMDDEAVSVDFKKIKKIFGNLD